MHLRTAEPREFGDINTLVQTAFLTAPVSDGLEHDLVRRLRSSPRYLPNLELVAIKNTQLIGHILAAEVTISSDHGPLNALEIAPLCVALEHRDQGIGTQLIKEVLRRGRTAKYPAVFLVGDPGYYHRFGFRPIAELNIRNLSPIPNEVTLGIELWPGAVNDLNGSISLI